MDVKQILEQVTNNQASDLFVIAGRPLSYKASGMMKQLNEDRLLPEQTKEFVESIYRLAERDINFFAEHGDDDFSFALPGISRFRVSTF